MKITKQLKYAAFEWDEEDKTFTVTDEDGTRVILNKVYAFAFMRFVVRMAQRNWLRQTKKAKKVVKEMTEVVEVENDIDHPDQLMLNALAELEPVVAEQGIH